MDKVIYRRPDRRKESNGNSDLIDNFFNSVVAKIVLLGISVFLFYNIGHAVVLTTQKVQILKRAQIEVENLRLKNLELATLLDSMQSVEYLEVEARDRLSFSGRKDTIFVIPETLLVMAGQHLDKILTEDYGELNMKYGFEVWRDFLLSGI
jgi:cell division protein FtsB